MSANSDLFSISQFPNGKVNLAKILNELIASPNLQNFRIAVAFARWDGIGLIAENLEKYLENGGNYETIFGVENGITTPDALLHCLYLGSIYKNYRYYGGIEPKFANSLFHSKFFDFSFADHRVLIVGSANLTGGGLERNSEFLVKIVTPTKHAFSKSMDEEWARLKLAAVKISPRIRAKAGKRACAVWGVSRCRTAP